MRLIPSFIPHSFLQSQFIVDSEQWDARYDEFVQWLDVYGIGELSESLVNLITAVKNPVYRQVQTEVQHILAYDTLMSYMNSCIAIAIMARLNILKAA